jgi:hypothetical protein
VFTVTFEETGSELIPSKETEEIKLTGLFTTGCQRSIIRILSILRKRSMPNLKLEKQMVERKKSFLMSIYKKVNMPYL